MNLRCDKDDLLSSSPGMTPAGGVKRGWRSGGRGGRRRWDDVVWAQGGVGVGSRYLDNVVGKLGQEKGEVK